MDDCILVWTHGEVNLLKFIEHCNEQHPNIHFTWESTAQGRPVSYMDLETTSDNNHPRYGLFQKPSDSGVSLNFDSCVPHHVKASVATQQFRCAETFSSDSMERRRSVDKVKTLLRDNGFGEGVIQTAFN